MHPIRKNFGWDAFFILPAFAEKATLEMENRGPLCYDKCDNTKRSVRNDVEEDPELVAGADTAGGYGAPSDGQRGKCGGNNGGNCGRGGRECNCA